MNEMTTVNTGNLVKFSIPESILDAVTRQLGGSGNYGTVEKNGGFKISGVEKTIPEIKGVIKDMTIYQARWEQGQMSKLDYTGGECSQGYQLRADMYVQINPDYELQLSLSPTSLKGAVSYLKSLQSQGISPNQVLTIFRTKQVTGNYGSYSICTFEATPLSAQAPQEMKNVTPNFTPPAPQHTETTLPAGWN
jgi:hypothetical protein